MAEVHGARTFRAPADAYNDFMGRYSRELASPFADFCGLELGQRFLDVGCGTGAFTAVAVERLGLRSVSAVDPVPHFVESVLVRLPGIDVRRSAAEELPFGDDEFDSAGAQLVFHFLSDPAQAVREMARVVRSGGIIAASAWDFTDGMEMLTGFWHAALSLWPDAPDEARTLRFGKEGELTELMQEAGLSEVTESVLTVTSSYQSFDHLWSTFLVGVGPAGAYCLTKSLDDQAVLRETFRAQMGHPQGPFTLGAVARAARARTAV